MMATTEAEDIIDGRKCANTKTQFRRKFLHFEKWIRERYPKCINEVTSTVNLLSVEKSHLMEFFGYICRERNRNGAFIDPTVFSFAWRAILWILTTYRIPYSCTHLVEHSTFRSTVYHKHSKFQTLKSSSNLNFK
jgi:hypothetical protein